MQASAGAESDHSLLRTQRRVADSHGLGRRPSLVSPFPNAPGRDRACCARMPFELPLAHISFQARGQRACTSKLSRSALRFLRPSLSQVNFARHYIPTSPRPEPPVCHGQVVRACNAIHYNTRSTVADHARHPLHDVSSPAARLCVPVLTTDDTQYGASSLRGGRQSLAGHVRFSILQDELRLALREIK